MIAGRTIAFTRGAPPADSFPVNEVAECADAILRQDPAVLLQYGKATGYLPLVEWIARARGRNVGEVLVSNGSLQIMDFLCQVLLAADDVVFVESPTYDRALTTFRRHRTRIVGIPIENDGVDLKAFEEALKHQAPRLFYAIADFQNPSGATTSAAKRERLVWLARKHGFWIVEDAPYRDLRYYGEPAPTMLSMAPDRVLQLSSFSKLLSPGIRTGYVVGPAEVVAKMTKVAEDTFITPVLPTQGIVYEYLRRGHLDQNLPRLRDLFRARLDATLASLARELPEATWMQPQGGYFVGVSLPGHIPSDVLLKRAAEAGLTLTDGDGFFPEKPTGTFVRIPFCGITPPEIQEGVARLAQVYRALG